MNNKIIRQIPNTKTYQKINTDALSVHTANKVQNSGPSEGENKQMNGTVQNARYVHQNRKETSSQ